MMNRRSFLTAASTGPWILGCGSVSRELSQPDIAIVIADDMSYTDVGCYGSAEVSTPNIDRLAAEGMRFTRSFAGTAMCSPMRQQMYTGIFPVRNGAYPNHSQIKPGIKTWPSYFNELGYRVGLAGKRHFGPVEQYPFDYLTKGGELDFEAIEEFIQRDPKQPYCLLITSNEPHGPHDKGDPARHPVGRMEVPEYWVDTPETRKSLAAYYAECEYLDGEVGRSMDLVGKGPHPGNTIFMYCSEQGSGMPFAKWTCYDLGLRQAVTVRWPGRIQPGSVAEAMVQGVDWLPTLLEAAGGVAPEGIDGRSFLPILEGHSDEHSDVVFGVHTTRGIINGSRCYPVRSVRDGRHKLILNLNHETEFRNVVTSPERENYWDTWVEKAKTDARAAAIVRRYQWRPAVEFYDIVADPFEQNNLAGSAEHAEKIERLTARLRSWMDSQGDLGNETEMQVKQHPTGEV